MTSHSDRAITIALFCSLTLIWSFSFLLIKVGLESFQPAALVFWRLLIGALVVSAAAWWGGAPLPRSGGALRLVLTVALLGNALPFYLIHRGELTVDSGVASLLMGSMPIATCVVAWLVIDEKPRALQLLGIAAGFGGLITLIGWDSLNGLGRAHGQLMIAGGAVCYAFSAVLVRRAGLPSTLWVAALTLWVAAVLTLPFALTEGFAFKVTPTLTIWASLAALGIGCTGLAQVIYYRLLGRVKANHFALINNFIPLLGYAWAILLLGENVRLSAVVAALLILSGARLVLSKPRAGL